MATSEKIKDEIRIVLSEFADISVRPMMGEYLLYMNGKLIGGIYDDRLLIKPTKSNASILPAPEFLIPYPGAKPMLSVGLSESKSILKAVLETTFAELPARKA